MKFRLLSCFAFILATAIHPFAQAQQRTKIPEQFDYDHELAIGDDAFNHQNYVEAEKHYRNAATIADQLHIDEKDIAAS